MDRIPFLCECAEPGCAELVLLTPAEYEDIRSSPTRFFNVPGHQQSGGSAVRVVREQAGYVVVEKAGEAAEVVIELDPRREDRRGSDEA